ncbi:hypothetical protein ISN44_As12g035510 [Arabidopsis suecica]|uniref:Uncharacterized protein n=1 Tax=Arabidopsis suecica TaxID=45249 RepID=A0A8T1YQR3_ARASU|nr:hypothetical protein ISN44_As12g035510 [Arabidopsis suecica]
MTNTNVAATKPTATTVHEYPSRLRVWWMNKDLQYNIAMNSFILILNIAAISYMITHKIAVESDITTDLLSGFGVSYIICVLVSFISWIVAITDVSVCDLGYTSGCVSHNLGFVVLLHFLYCISLNFALLVGLLYVLPFFLCLLCIAMQALRDWWEFVNQPQSVVVEGGYMQMQ